MTNYAARDELGVKDLLRCMRSWDWIPGTDKRDLNFMQVILDGWAVV